MTLTVVSMVGMKEMRVTRVAVRQMERYIEVRYGRLKAVR
jgi:hypothetical protein